MNTWLAAAFIPLALLLWRRTTGGIAPRSTLTYSVFDPEGNLNLRWGPYREWHCPRIHNCGFLLLFLAFDDPGNEG